MSTRSTIWRKVENGYEGIYCHFDGYVKDGVGETLIRNYTGNDQKVQDLISLGDISVLGTDTTNTIAYHRDRKEPELNIFSVKNINQLMKKNSLCDGEFIYIYHDGKWYNHHDNVVEI